MQNILELMDCGIHRDPARFHTYLTSAKEQLRTICSRPCPDPAPGSHVSLVFDPFVARRLNSFGPLRIHKFPTQGRIWEALGCFLNDWDELRLLCDTTSISTWEVRLLVAFFKIISKLKRCSRWLDAFGPGNLGRNFLTFDHLHK
jgi:N-alpha-acetyltransferase 35, NatC auxiliary subunit